VFTSLDRLIRCDESAVLMRFCTGQASTQLTLFTRSGTAGWTADGEYFLWNDDFHHGIQMMLPFVLWRWSIFTILSYLVFLLHKTLSLRYGTP
jgi:hypothetical protein